MDRADFEAYSLVVGPKIGGLPHQKRLHQKIGFTQVGLTASAANKQTHLWCLSQSVFPDYPKNIQRTGFNCFLIETLPDIDNSFWEENEGERQF